MILVMETKRVQNVSLPKETIHSEFFLQQHDLTKITNKLDIAFLGSSHTYKTFDVRFYEKKGLNTFNFGTIAQTVH